MDERARFETALALVDSLVEANQQAPILVEGRRDIVALRAVGCEGEIIALHRGARLADIAHDIADRVKEVILLPDWDRAGLDLRDALRAHLQAHALTCDTRYHERLVQDTQLALKDVESLPLYLSRGLHKFLRMTLEEHVRARRGDALGVRGLHEEFPPAPMESSKDKSAGPRPKRRARPR